MAETTTADQAGGLLGELRALAPMVAGPSGPLKEAVNEISRTIANGGWTGPLQPLADEVFSVCKVFYSHGRSADGLALPQALLARCDVLGDEAQALRAIMVCGTLAGNSGDIVAAIEYNARALRLAEATGDKVEMSRIWNNIGATIAITGNYDLSIRCYRRVLALTAHVEEPLSPRFNACLNLSNNYYQLGRFEEGLAHAERAAAELTAEMIERDPHSAVLLRRNFVRLTLGLGRLEEARRHADATAVVAGHAASPRATIAVDIARATVEIATGNADMALTRIDRALAAAREFPGILHDALASAVRAEEAAGNPGRALVRMEELSGLVYTQALEKMRRHIQLFPIRSGPEAPVNPQREQARARLTSKLESPSPPAGWATLQRLAVGAVLRMDPTGWHGKRVGALVKALAIAMGSNPLQALELGLAAELHDIGLPTVPEGIFRRRGGLNDSERQIMQRHTDAGAELLRDDRHPRVFLAREVAKYHHARWDGTGHPYGVAGLAIPLGARMCAVADAYDAMVCGLAGHEPMTMDQALGELKAQSGRQFDPELVSCFDALVRDQLQDRGVDLETGGMEDFQALITTLQEDRGFV